MHFLYFFVNQKWVEWDYLINFPDPAVNAIKRPAVSDVIHEQDALWNECPTC